jgi:hypothetical protein
VLPQGARSILGAPNVVDRDRRWGVEEQAAARAARREGSKPRLLSWPKANATERSSCCETVRQLYGYAVFTEIENLGHVAFEQPALFTQELRECFRRVRGAYLEPLT